MSDDVFMSGDTTVTWTGSRDSHLAGWIFNAWQFRPGREDVPIWVTMTHDMPTDGSWFGYWLLRKAPDPIVFAAVTDEFFAANFRRM